MPSNSTLPFTAMVSSLQSILRSTAQLETLVKGDKNLPHIHVRPSSPAQRIVLSIDTVFPFPTAILPDIIALGVDISKAQQASRTYIHHCQQLRETCYAKYTQAVDKLSHHNRTTSALSEALENAMRQVYTRSLKKIKDELLLVAQRSKGATSHASGHKKSIYVSHFSRFPYGVA
jgi:hypothetical protein